MKQFAIVICLFVLALSTNLNADPPTPDPEAEAKQADRARELLKKEEARRLAYNALRSEIVDMRPRQELTELNLLAQMADRGLLDQAAATRLDEAGPAFLTGRLRLFEAVVIFDQLYGQRSGEKEMAAGAAKELTGALDAATEALTLVRGFIQTTTKTLPRAKRWEKWEEKLRQKGARYNFDDPAYKVVSRTSPLNVMATAVDTEILKKDDVRGLDGFGPFFVEMLFKTQRGEKIDPALNEQYDSLYNTWYHALLGIPQSERWQKWADGMEWPDTTEGQRVLARLIEEEEKARAEKK